MIIRLTKKIYRTFIATQKNSVTTNLLLGKLLSQYGISSQSTNLHDYEFKVFSQWGDDGIIQHIVRNLHNYNPIFIEFGVENYEESNTRFLMINNNWSGLILDGSKQNIDYVKSQELYWQNDLQAEAVFVTKNNINEIIGKYNLENIGLLHIDIDGMDYWVWEALETNTLNPALVILEYNSVFGVDKAITVPYSDDFYRTTAHHSNLYYGASLKALQLLSMQKGYAFVGCNSAGNNAYFVRRDQLSDVLPEVSIEEGYVESKFRESRDMHGALTYVRAKDRLAVIKGLPAYNVKSNTTEYL